MFVDVINYKQMFVDVINYKHEFFVFIIRIVFKRNNFYSIKFTRKFDFIEKMKQIRYEWCKIREHWIIKNWKKIIWIDEINVIMCESNFFVTCQLLIYIFTNRKNNQKIWRKFFEKYHKTCVKNRWKNEFFFIVVFWINIFKIFEIYVEIVIIMTKKNRVTFEKTKLLKKKN